MRRALIAFLVLLLIVAVPCSVLGKPKASVAAARCAVTNPNHTQVLGGPSQRAGNGLQNAAVRSGAIAIVPDGDKGSIVITDPVKK